ncbi:MAG: hypothetical protein U0531_18710 [Dehalococcoidia bacterium]
MTMSHARAQLDDLIRTVARIRTLTLDGPRYKLWLGDVVEFVHGNTLVRRRRRWRSSRPSGGAARPLPRDAAEAERTHRYLSRLDAGADAHRLRPPPG